METDDDHRLERLEALSPHRTRREHRSSDRSWHFRGAHAASGALFAFDAADSLVQALAKLSAPKSLVSWFGKRAPLNLPDLEYRTFSTTTRANARIAQARMIDRRETYLRGAA